MRLRHLAHRDGRDREALAVKSSCEVKLPLDTYPHRRDREMLHAYYVHDTFLLRFCLIPTYLNSLYSTQ